MSRACTAELVETIPVRNTLGEGVSWDPVEEFLWWTDIQGLCLYRYDPRTRALKRYQVPERLCSFGFVENSARLIVAFESGFALYDPDSGRRDWIARPRHDAANIRFNDGRVDRQGRFWAGSMTEGPGAPRGKLYCLDGLEARVQLTNIGISNSICFSPNGRQMYFADTPRREILRYEVDAITGGLSCPHTFARLPAGAFPDGSNVDADGHLWNAQWSAGKVVCYAPDGGISAEIDIPASQPTCIAFGGRQLDLLFVTSAREGLSAAALRDEPHAGDVFIYKVNVKGLPDRRFRTAPSALTVER